MPPHTSAAQTRQMVGSLIVALLIVVGVVVAVTARLGPTSLAELRAREELAEEQAEQAEQAREDRADAARRDDDRSGRRARRDD